MSELPKVGLYISKKTGVQIYVESSFGDNPEEFYLVEIIDEASKDDVFSVGDELDKNQWESLVKEHELEYEA